MSINDNVGQFSNGCSDKVGQGHFGEQKVQRNMFWPNVNCHVLSPFNS